MDSAGNLYGTTELGGALKSGTVFEVNPNATPTGVILSPSSLTFGTFNAGTMSPPAVVQTEITLQTRRWTSTIFDIGDNASDFAIALSDVGTNCQATPSLASGGGECGMLVVFTPSTGGNESAVLSVADSEGTQTVTLAGTGVLPISPSPHFGSPSNATVTAGAARAFS